MTAVSIIMTDGFPYVAYVHIFIHLLVPTHQTELLVLGGLASSACLAISSVLYHKCVNANMIKPTHFFQFS